MIQKALQNYPHVHLNIIAMFIFLAFFIGAVAWTYRRSGRKFYDAMANKPLED